MSVLIDTEEIGTIEGLHAIREEWCRLLEACPGATPFQFPEWLVPWWKIFGQGSLMTIAMRAEGRLCGLAPLHIENGKIQFLGAGVSDYLGLILLPSLEARGAQELLKSLAARGGWSSCSFQELAPSSPLIAIKPPDGLRAELAPGEICLCVDLPSTVGEFRKRHGRTGRCGSKKIWRRLAARGLKIETAVDEAKAVSFLHALFRLHSEQWEAAGLSGVLQGPEIRAFHEETALGFLKKGMLRLYRMVLEGRELAVFYGFAHRSRLYAYLTGYDPGFSKLSLGRILLLSVAEDCITRGVARLDFLRGAEKYKYDWEPLESRNHTLIITNGIYNGSTGS